MKINYRCKIEKNHGEGLKGYGYKLIIYKNDIDQKISSIAYPTPEMAYIDFIKYLDHHIFTNGRIETMSITCQK